MYEFFRDSTTLMSASRTMADGTQSGGIKPQRRTRRDRVTVFPLQPCLTHLRTLSGR